MTRLSCDVPVVICRWKQGNARRLQSVLWSGSLIGRSGFAYLPRSLRAKVKPSEGGLLDFFEAASRPLDVLGMARRGSSRLQEA